MFQKVNVSRHIGLNCVFAQAQLQSISNYVGTYSTYQQLE